MTGRGFTRIAFLGRDADLRGSLLVTGRGFARIASHGLHGSHGLRPCAGHAFEFTNGTEKEPTSFLTALFLTGR
jgi:hypothetical protein